MLLLYNYDNLRIRLTISILIDNFKINISSYNYLQSYLKKKFIKKINLYFIYDLLIFENFSLILNSFKLKVIFFLYLVILYIKK